MAKPKVTDLYREEPLYPKQRLRMSLPLPPSVNHMYIMRGGHVRTLTKVAKDYIGIAQRKCAEAMKLCDWKQEAPHVWYVMDLEFYFPDRINRDSHNCLKLLTDVLQGTVYKNDYFVLPRIQYVHYDKENPRVEVEIYPQ